MLKAIGTLPIEIWNQILLNLDLKDLLHLSRCNYKLRYIVTNNIIWEHIAFEMWGQYEQFDILQDYLSNSQSFHSVRKKSQYKGRKLPNFWYSYCMERLHSEHQYIKKLNEIVQHQYKISYWDELWDLLQHENFILYVPLLNDILDSEFLIQESFSNRPKYTDSYYRVSKLQLLNCSKTPLCFKKISFELLSGFRHKHLFQFNLLYRNSSINDIHNADFNDTFFTTDDNCEKLLLQYNKIDTAYHRLIPYRHKFLKLFKQILETRNKNYNINFSNLTTLTRLEILSNLMMNLLKRNETNFLKNNYIEDLMILRVYSGETKGTLLIQLTILQRIFLEYGIECQLLQRHLKICFHNNNKDNQSSKYLYLTVIQESLQCKIFTENQLRTVIRGNHFSHYMKPLSKQDALKWLYNDSISNYKSNIETNEINDILTKWDRIYCHSHLPLSKSKLKSFNIFYNSLFSGKFFNTELKLSYTLSGSFNVFMEGMTPLDYKLLDHIHVGSSDSNKLKIRSNISDYLQLQQMWLSNQYMIKDGQVSNTTTTTTTTSDNIVVGNLYTTNVTPRLSSIFCVIYILNGLKDTNSMIIMMDILGDIHKISEKDFFKNVKQTNWSIIKNQSQLEIYIRTMSITGKLGYLFDHFDAQKHQYILSSILFEDKK